MREGKQEVRRKEQTIRTRWSQSWVQRLRGYCCYLIYLDRQLGTTRSSRYYPICSGAFDLFLTITTNKEKSLFLATTKQTSKRPCPWLLLTTTKQPNILVLGCSSQLEEEKYSCSWLFLTSTKQISLFLGVLDNYKTSKQTNKQTNK